MKVIQKNLYDLWYTLTDKLLEKKGIAKEDVKEDLREHLTGLANSAINPPKGVWQHDRSTDNPQITQKSDLFQLAIWPKLYRRLAKYYDDPQADHANLFGFRDWLHEDRSGRDDLVLVLPIGELLNLSDILTITSTTISLDYSPSELVIVPR
jgi:hypothetical protein